MNLCVIGEGFAFLSGSKLAAQTVGIETAAPVSRLHVAGTNPTLTVGPFGIGQAEGRIVATGSAAELSFVRRTRTNWNPPINAGDRWVWYSPDGTARLWTEGNGDLVTVTSSGQVGIGTIAPHAGSRLHVVGNGNQGVILPHVSLSDATSWSPLAGTQTAGMIVYNASSNGSGSNRVLPGYHFWNGSRWVPMQPWYPVMGETENTLYTIPGTCLCNNNCNQYTGTYIDLPPGRWAIVALSPGGVKSNTVIPPGRTVSGQFRFFTSNNCSAASLVNAPHIEGRITGEEHHGYLAGITVIANSGSSTVRYYLCGCVYAQYNCPGCGFTEWARTHIIAFPLSP